MESTLGTSLSPSSRTFTVRYDFCLCERTPDETHSANFFFAPVQTTLQSTCGMEIVQVSALLDRGGVPALLGWIFPSSHCTYLLHDDTTEGLQDEGEYEDSDEEIELENEKVKKKKVETSSGMAGQLHPDWKAAKVGQEVRDAILCVCVISYS